MQSSCEPRFKLHLRLSFVTFLLFQPRFSMKENARDHQQSTRNYPKTILRTPNVLVQKNEGEVVGTPTRRRQQGAAGFARILLRLGVAPQPIAIGSSPGAVALSRRPISRAACAPGSSNWLVGGTWLTEPTRATTPVVVNRQG